MAKQGLDAIFAHAILSGSNGVIDEKTFMPNAGYWAAPVWRKTVGTQVLDAGPIRPSLHVYAHCLRGARGGVTVMAINLEPTPASVAVTSPANVYALRAPELQSKTVLLNGRPLALGPGDTVPELLPAKVNGGVSPWPGTASTSSSCRRRAIRTAHRFCNPRGAAPRGRRLSTLWLRGLRRVDSGDLVTSPRLLSWVR